MLRDASGLLFHLQALSFPLLNPMLLSLCVSSSTISVFMHLTSVLLPISVCLPWDASSCVCLWHALPRPPSAAVISIQREPISAVSSDITFPMRGRRGMKDWVRHSEDRLFLPKEVLSLSSPGKPATPGAATAGSPSRGRGPGTVPPGPGHAHQRLLPADPEESSSYFVIGAVLYRTLGLILPPPR